MTLYKIDQLQDIFDSFEVVTPVMPPEFINSRVGFCFANELREIYMAPMMSKDLEQNGLLDVYFEMKNNFCKERGRFWEYNEQPFFVDFFFTRTDEQEDSPRHVIGAIQHNDQLDACSIEWVWFHPFARSKGLFSKWVATKAQTHPVFLVPPTSTSAAIIVKRIMDQASEKIRNKGLNAVIGHIEGKRGVDFSAYNLEDKLDLGKWHNVFAQAEDRLEESGANYKRFNEVVNQLLRRKDFQKFLIDHPVEVLLNGQATNMLELIELIQTFAPEVSLKEIVTIQNVEKHSTYSDRMEKYVGLIPPKGRS